ncbi:hypothetical protein [Pseudanabaena mucicola]|uniref:hypothetical protein n=1 Tax=Pseudanabaena mucicola TaxID=71190 RepID=UPI00257514C1|nr:hypothetical protein [Pseudanabaena mucicola]
MSRIWIVTTGNSDIQLTSIPEKWDNLCKEKKSDLKPCLDDFRSKEGINKQKSGLYTVVARLLGVIFFDKIDDYRNYFEFPLLDGFCKKINENSIKPDRIIVLLTDQEAIFLPNHENILYNRSDSDSPYWKDTCTLEPIFEDYFQDKYGIKIEPVYLKPEAGQIGLDDWNVTLKLVQDKFSGLGIKQDDQVIVSHQAGTPAISSAVQFASLSNFGDRVRFLTSNERTKVASLDPSSSYFESMQIEQAKKFLNNYDYVSVFTVLKSKLERLKNADQADRILKLLEVAKFWNLSKFDEFRQAMENLSTPSLRDVAISRFSESWSWWIAYEEAYLGIIRRNQGNIVEAFFHTFRAFEGIFAEWGNHFFNGNENEYVDLSKDIPYLKADVLNDPKNYLSGSDLKKLRDKIQENGGIDLELSTLCKIFKEKRKNYKQKCTDIITFWDNDKEKRISARRNFIFHQVQGITEERLLFFWLVNSVSEWEGKILRFLNFIADEKEFKMWEEASLMAQVHEELVKEIGAIANIPNS